MRQTVIGITGPSGIGKSWLCKQLVNKVPVRLLTVIGTGELIWNRFKNEIPGWDTQLTYEDFKHSAIQPSGRLGRIELIEFLETKRAEDPVFLARIVWSHIMMHNVNERFILIDSFANEPEFMYYQNELKNHKSYMDYVHVTINHYYTAHGEPYSGEYRTHVDYPWAHRYRTSEEAFQDILRSIDLTPPNS